ncbi:MAG: hypothetical protein Kapaf2KO_11330 [Candidatus Kapaibacteriales bacterium]
MSEIAKQQITTDIKPTSYKVHLASAITLVLISSLVLFLSLTSELSLYDEAITLVGAERILAGEHPYLDFWTIYPPAQFYLLAGFFSFIGSSILAERLITLVTVIFLGWAWLAIAKRAHFGRSRYFGLLALSLWFFMFPLFGRAIPSALALLFASSVLLFRYFETRDNRLVYFVGFLTGLAALFRHDLAGFLFGVFFQAVFFFSLSQPEIKDKSKSQRILFGLKNAMKSVAGLVPLLIPFFIMWHHLGIEYLWEHFIELPLGDFGDYRELPFPNPFILPDEGSAMAYIARSLLFWFPLAVFLITILGIIYRVIKKKMILNGKRFWIEITCFNIGINLFNTAMVRSDLEHVMPAYLGAILCMLVIFDWIERPFRRGVVTTLAMLSIMVFPTAYFARHIAELATSEKVIANDFGTFPSSLDRDFAEEYFKAVQVGTLNAKGGRTFSTPKKTNDFVLGDLMIYHLTGTLPTGYFHEPHPGITNRFEAQETIIKSIDSIRPRLIYVTDFGKSEEPNLSSNMKQADLLMPYIKSHYIKLETYGNYQIYALEEAIIEGF